MEAKNHAVGDILYRCISDDAHVSEMSERVKLQIQYIITESFVNINISRQE